MTKTNNRSSNTTQHRLPLYRRAWFLALIVVIIIAAIVYLIFALVKPHQNSESSATTANNTSPETTESTGDQIPDGQHNDEDAPYSDPDQITVQYEGENPNRASDLSGNITYTDYNNGTLSIGTMINQYLGDGTCELKLTGNSGNTYSASAQIFAAASTSACEDFNINVSPDTYQIEILLSSGEKQGIITGEVSL